MTTIRKGVRRLKKNENPYLKEFSLTRFAIALIKTALLKRGIV